MIRNMGRTLIVCGHGMVAQRFLEELMDKTTVPYQNILVFSSESLSAYNRIQLSSVLSGEANEESLALKPNAWFARHGIRVHYGVTVEAINPGDHTVTTDLGQVYRYDSLVIATGASPAPLGIPGEGLNNVMTFRNLSDTRTLIEMTRKARRAVVIGGGFLGLEAAEGLARRGMAVTVLHRSGYPLNRQLDPEGGKLLSAALAARGIRVLTSITPIQLTGRDQVRVVQLNDRALIDTDLVVIATGITPNRKLAQNAGLACGRGIRVNAQLQTSDPDIFAVGECCELNGQTFGLVEPGYQQAKTLANVLAGPDLEAAYRPITTATRLKISGIPVFSCGQQVPDTHTESLIWQDLATGSYSHLLVRGNRLVGAILVGSTGQGSWYHKLITESIDIDPFRAQLPFGKPFCDAAA